MATVTGNSEKSLSVWVLRTETLNPGVLAATSKSPALTNFAFTGIVTLFSLSALNASVEIFDMLSSSLLTYSTSAVAAEKSHIPAFTGTIPKQVPGGTDGSFTCVHESVLIRSFPSTVPEYFVAE